MAQIREMRCQYRKAMLKFLTDLQELLHFPDGLEVEAILSLGYPLHPIRPRKLADVRPFRVHWGKWE